MRGIWGRESVKGEGSVCLYLRADECEVQASDSFELAGENIYGSRRERERSTALRYITHLQLYRAKSFTVWSVWRQHGIGTGPTCIPQF